MPRLRRRRCCHAISDNIARQSATAAMPRLIDTYVASRHDAAPLRAAAPIRDAAALRCRRAMRFCCFFHASCLITLITPLLRHAAAIIAALPLPSRSEEYVTVVRLNKCTLKCQNNQTRTAHAFSSADAA